MASRFVLTAMGLLLLCTTMEARVRRPYTPSKPKPILDITPIRPIDSRPLPIEQDISRRMSSLEQESTRLKTEMNKVTTENMRLGDQMVDMNRIVDTLKESQTRVEKLQWMLGKFERFFGVLYRELPDVFADEMQVDQRMSKLNDYIGNREAELMAVRGSLPTEAADPAEHPISEDLLGRAMVQLTTANEHLKSRLDTMEANDPMSRFGDGSRPSPPDGETDDRIERLERLIALQLAPVLDADLSAFVPGAAMPRLGSVAGKQMISLSKSDKDLLQEELGAVRSLASTRKSVFSAAATRPAQGVSGVHKHIHFDHVHANKGGHLQEDNSTFICHITGYYFITYTVRSYDHKYLGVNLLHNGNRVNSVHSEADPEKNTMMSQSIALHLKKGDKMWLTISPSDSFAIYSDAGGKFCTFSGFLLFKGN